MSITCQLKNVDFKIKISMAGLDPAEERVSEQKENTEEITQSAAYRKTENIAEERMSVAQRENEENVGEAILGNNG